MLQSKIDTQLQHNLRFNHSLVTKKVLPNFEDLFFLIQPEDSSNKSHQASCDMNCHHPNTMRDAIKTIFWVAVSIIVAIAIAQLN